MAVIDPEGAERHVRDSEFTRARLTKMETEPPRHRVYTERPAEVEAPAPARRRVTKRKR